MKYRLNIKPYVTQSDTSLVQTPGHSPKPREVNVKQAIANVIMSPDQRHNGFRLVTVAKVVSKIKACQEDYVILEPQEMAILKESFDKLQGFGLDDVELCQRIYEPEKVEE